MHVVVYDYDRTGTCNGAAKYLRTLVLHLTCFGQDEAMLAQHFPGHFTARVSCQVAELTVAVSPLRIDNPSSLVPTPI